MRWSKAAIAQISAPLIEHSFSLRTLRILCELCGKKLFSALSAKPPRPRRLKAFALGSLFLCLASFCLSQTAAEPGQNTQPQPPLIIIDPAHGGADSGAALNSAFPEKDVTLVLARRLRQELATRGIQVLLLRDADTTLSTDQRAAMVNASHPALYVVLHATSQGSGIHLFTAMLPATDVSRGPFSDWNIAQSSALPRSRLLANQIAATIQRGGISVRSLGAPLRPLDNIIAPAFAVEIAPSDGEVSQLASSDFQESVCAVLANALASTIPMLKAQSPQGGQ